MTVQHARQLLGKEARNLSDEQILQLNGQTKEMCRALLSIILDTSKIDTSMKEDNNG